MSTLTVLAISNGDPASKTNRWPVAASSKPTPKATFFPRGRSVSVVRSASSAEKGMPMGGDGLGLGFVVGAGVGAEVAGLAVAVVAPVVSAVVPAVARVVVGEPVGAATGAAAGVRSVSTSMSPPTVAPPKAAIATRRVT